MKIRKYSTGNITGSIVFVGECLGTEELNKGAAFSGYAGFELYKMLGEAGISKNDCYFTNVVNDLAPSPQFHTKKVAKKLGLDLINDRYPSKKLLPHLTALREELESLEPNLIVPLGDVALWALTGLSDGITKWRGSIIPTPLGKMIPTFNPANILRSYSNRWVMVQDLRRISKESLTPEIKKPPYHFLTKPNFLEALDAIESLRGKTSTCDIETLWNQIECIGFGTSPTSAFCIPIISRSSPTHSYWSYEEELEITLALRSVMTDPSTHLIFQNASFDLQWIAKQWGFVPPNISDTMLMMHICFNGLPKGLKPKSLNFMSSLFCDYYTYWKDERKDADDEQNWNYNCQDCTYTFECFSVLGESLEKLDLTPQFQFQSKLFWAVFKMMLKGVSINTKAKLRLSGELLRAQKSRMDWLEDILGEPLNPRSPKQMQELFYDSLGMRPVKDRKTGSVTTNSNALALMRTRQPLLIPLIDTIEELRSIGVFKSTFVDSNIDADNRVRCNFNLAGTETFRFSSSKSPFGTGLNLQTIPEGREE